MKYFLLLLLASTARAAPLVNRYDIGSGVSVFLSSQSFTASTAFSMNVTVPSSSTVDCRLTYIQNTVVGYPQITFNSDVTAGHYAYSGEGQSTGGVANNPSNSAAFIVVGLSGQTADVGTVEGSAFTYSSALTAGTMVSGQASVTSSNFMSMFWSGIWKASAFPTKITITASAGTMSGYIKCTYTN